MSFMCFYWPDDGFSLACLPIGTNTNEGTQNIALITVVSNFAIIFPLVDGNYTLCPQPTGSPIIRIINRRLLVVKALPKYWIELIPTILCRPQQVKGNIKGPPLRLSVTARWLPLRLARKGIELWREYTTRSWKSRESVTFTGANIYAYMELA